MNVVYICSLIGSTTYTQLEAHRGKDQRFSVVCFRLTSIVTNGRSVNERLGKHSVRSVKSRNTPDSAGCDMMIPVIIMIMETEDTHKKANL